MKLQFSLALVALFSIRIAAGDTYTVSNTLDAGPGSFRQAILDANTRAGSDTISFNIPGNGVHTITPTTELPAIITKTCRHMKTEHCRLMCRQRGR